MCNDPLFLCNLTDLKLNDENLLTTAPRPLTSPAAQQSGNWNKSLGIKKSPNAPLQEIRPLLSNHREE